MPACHEMKKEDIYYCEDCGLELKVVKECDECGTSDATCNCSSCSFICCDKELQLKQKS